MQGVKKDIHNYPANAEAHMIADNNLTWAAENHDRILAERTKRYDSKSEPMK